MENLKPIIIQKASKEAIAAYRRYLIPPPEEFAHFVNDWHISPNIGYTVIKLNPKLYYVCVDVTYKKI